MFFSKLSRKSLRFTLITCLVFYLALMTTLVFILIPLAFKGGSISKNIVTLEPFRSSNTISQKDIDEYNDIIADSLKNMDDLKRKIDETEKAVNDVFGNSEKALKDALNNNMHKNSQNIDDIKQQFAVAEKAAKDALEKVDDKLYENMYKNVYDLNVNILTVVSELNKILARNHDLILQYLDKSGDQNLKAAYILNFVDSHPLAHSTKKDQLRVILDLNKADILFRARALAKLSSIMLEEGNNKQALDYYTASFCIFASLWSKIMHNPTPRPHTDKPEDLESGVSSLRDDLRASTINLENNIGPKAYLEKIIEKAVINDNSIIAGTDIFTAKNTIFSD